jgi:hypothetical protein
MARETIDEMIAEAGGLPDSAINWAREQFDGAESSAGAA